MQKFKRTRKGYDPFECLSAIQKALRRGDEELALYFALEMCFSGYWSWVRNRLRIVAYEDVSIADPSSVTLALHALRDFDEMRKGNNDSWRLPLATAMLALARCKKSRIANHFQAAIMDDLESQGPKEFPDYVYDMHTREGKKLGRGIEHFLAECGKLENEININDPYKERAAQYWIKEEKKGKKHENNPEQKSGQAGFFNSSSGKPEED